MIASRRARRGSSTWRARSHGLLLLLVLGAVTVSHLTTTAVDAADDHDSAIDEPTIEGRVVERGHYEMSAHQDLPSSVEAISRMILDVEAQCAKGCRYRVPEISRSEIIERSLDRLVTWTHVDSLLDASYFTTVTVDRRDDGLSLVFETPDAADIERWETKARAHDPFFHHQRTVWRLDELHNSSGLASGEVAGTRVSLEMAMRSNRGLINLMPGQVLSGSRRHLEQMFAHFRTIGEEKQAPDADAPD